MITMEVREMPKVTRNPKDVSIAFRIDTPTLATLDAIAAAEFDDNRSLAVRQLVRKHAERCGIVAGGKPDEGRNGEEDGRV